MIILYMNCTYNTGSTGKIVSALYDYSCKNGNDTYVIYGMGETVDDAHVIRVVPWSVRKLQSLRARITGYPYGGCIWGTWKALDLIEKIMPDIVHIHCVNGYMVNIYRILKYLKKNNIPTVITNHAEFLYTGGCTHAVECNKWLTGCHDCNKINKEHPKSYFFDRTRKEWLLLRNAYDGFEKLTVCCVSDWVTKRASQSPFFKGTKVITVMNGLDTDTFCYRDTSDLRLELGLKGKRVVLHVTPNFHDAIKGGQHVLEMARRLPEYEFVIIGCDACDGAPLNCHFAGKIYDQILLAQYYSMADICLLTSVRETFSMVCAESLCCGTPVVGFKAGGPETISLPSYSVFVEQGNDDQLEKALKAVIASPFEKQEMSNSAVKTYGQKTMCENYFSVYQELIG